jgi:hypothetical protein
LIHPLSDTTIFVTESPFIHKSKCAPIVAYRLLLIFDQKMR